MSRRKTVILAQEGRRKELAPGIWPRRPRYVTAIGLFGASLAMSACAEPDPDLALEDDFEALVEAEDGGSARRMARVSLQLTTPTQHFELNFIPQPSATPPPAEGSNTAAAAAPDSAAPAKRNPRAPRAQDPAEPRRLATATKSPSAKAEVPAQLSASPEAPPAATKLDSGKFKVQSLRRLASSSSGLQVQADFAEFQGVQEALVWAYAGVQEPHPARALDVGECRRASQLQRDIARQLHAAAPGHPVTSGRGPGHEAEEHQGIELLDVGPLQMSWGLERYSVPMRLAPEILTYASGVQYRGQHTVLDSRRLVADRPSAISLQWSEVDDDNSRGGRHSEHILQSLSLPTPSPLEVTVARPEGNLIKSESQPGYELPRWIDVRWEPDPQQSAMFLHTSLVDDKGEAIGPAVVCRVEDSGQWQIDFDQLAELGLELRGSSLEPGERSQPLRVELRRTHRFVRAVSGFERISVEVERRASLQVLHSIAG